MKFDYDKDNLFARLLRGEIPNDTVAESEHTLAFRDIRPQMKEHILVIPKGAYVSLDDFAANASEAEIVDFMRLCAKIAKDTGLSVAAGGRGFRAIANSGPDSLQEVPHFHLHILGGEVAGPLLAR
ncbi:MAG: HIT domain-containing protein [Paracoccus sp. (in: a-proteobacteria)]|nr:HIT domain-containing protein [Paracoccus sp. (in: a-proteobacteria)]